MTGIRYLTDEKSRKVAVQIDLKKHEISGRISGTVFSTARRKEKSVPYEQYCASRVKRTEPRA